MAAPLQSLERREVCERFERAQTPQLQERVVSKKSRAVPPVPVLTITYWGVTGSFPAPLRPAQVLEKVHAAVHHLVRMKQMAGRAQDVADIEKLEAVGDE